MKIVISTVLLSLLLFARINPFESTDTFEERKNKLLESQVQENEVIINTPVEKIIPIEEVNESEPIVVKKELQVQDGCNESYVYNLLPFILVSTSKDSFMVKIKDKYKLINQDINIQDKKLVFDFKGKTNFYTKREKLCHKYFKSFAIGCHRDKNYFRVVLDLKEDVLKYQDKIDNENNTIVIEYIGN